MNASELKAAVMARGTETHFFDRRTMQAFGDTMKNYGVRKATIRVRYDAEGNFTGNPVDCEVWELYRRRPVCKGEQGSAYFREDTLTITFPVKD